MIQSGEPADANGPREVSRERLLLRTWSDGEAAVVRQLLDQYGIACRVVSDVTHAVLPLSVDGLGEIRLLVASDRFEEAEQILAEHRRQGLEIVSDSGPDDPSDEPDA